MIWRSMALIVPLAIAARPAASRAQRPRPAFGGIVVQATSLAGRGAVAWGGGGGERFGAATIGVGGYGISTTGRHPAGGVVRGGVFGVVLGAERPFARSSLVASALLGGGGFDALGADGNRQARTSLLVVQPSVGARFELPAHLRIGLDAGYRLTAGGPLAARPARRLGGRTVGLTLLYRWP